MGDVWLMNVKLGSLMGVFVRVMSYNQRHVIICVYSYIFAFITESKSCNISQERVSMYEIKRTEWMWIGKIIKMFPATLDKMLNEWNIVVCHTRALKIHEWIMISALLTTLLDKI